MPFAYATELFSGAETGDVWLADSGDHYQDTGRTTAAGNGDPVGSATGQASNFNANQGNALLKPTLVQDAGGKWYFDHAGDWLSAGTTSDWNYLHSYTSAAGYACIAFRAGATAEPNALYGLLTNSSASSSSRGCALMFDDRTGLGDRALRYYLSKGSAPPPIDFFSVQAFYDGGEDHLLEVFRAATSVQVYLDAQPLMVYTHTEGTGSSSHSLHIGALGGGGSPLTGRVYAALATDTTPSDTQLAGIRLDMFGRMIAPPVIVNTASVTLTGFPASESGINVAVRVDGESAPFYYATGQSANGSGELAIAATGCPLATGTRTVLITCDNTDGTAGGLSNNHRAFHDYVEVTVS